jgi:Zn-dependent protease with chaperone function
MNVQSVLSGVIFRYSLAQAILLPLMLFSWFIIPKHASLRFQWAFHRVLVVLTITLPILLSLPGASSIAHAIGDRTVRAPSVEPPMMAPLVAQPETTTKSSPALPDLDLRSVEDAPIAATPRAVSPILTITVVLDRFPAGLGACSLLGLLGFLVLIGRQLARERRIHATASRIQRIGKISIVASDLVRSPFSTGLLWPRIYVPTGIVTSSVRRRMVLAHEAIHVRRLHIAWTFIERLHAALCWYNPLAHLVAINGSRLRELLCDRGAGGIHGDVAYCRVLLDAAESLDDTFASHGLANAWIGRRFLRRRIEFIALRLGMTSNRWIFVAAPIAALLSLVVFLGCGPRVLPELASSTPMAAPRSTPSVTTLTQKEGAWPDSTITITETLTEKFPTVEISSVISGTGYMPGMVTYTEVESLTNFSGTYYTPDAVSGTE